MSRAAPLFTLTLADAKARTVVASSPCPSSSSSSSTTSTPSTSTSVSPSLSSTPHSPPTLSSITHAPSPPPTTLAGNVRATCLSYVLPSTVLLDAIVVKSRSQLRAVQLHQVALARPSAGPATSSGLFRVVPHGTSCAFAGSPAGDDDSGEQAFGGGAGGGVVNRSRYEVRGVASEIKLTLVGLTLTPSGSAVAPTGGSLLRQSTSPGPRASSRSRFVPRPKMRRPATATSRRAKGPKLSIIVPAASSEYDTDLEDDIVIHIHGFRLNQAPPPSTGRLMALLNVVTALQAQLVHAPAPTGGELWVAQRLDLCDAEFLCGLSLEAARSHLQASEVMHRAASRLYEMSTALERPDKRWWRLQAARMEMVAAEVLRETAMRDKVQLFHYAACMLRGDALTAPSLDPFITDSLSAAYLFAHDSILGTAIPLLRGHAAGSEPSLALPVQLSLLNTIDAVLRHAGAAVSAQLPDLVGVLLSTFPRPPPASRSKPKRRRSSRSRPMSSRAKRRLPSLHAAMSPGCSPLSTETALNQSLRPLVQQYRRLLQLCIDLFPSVGSGQHARLARVVCDELALIFPHGNWLHAILVEHPHDPERSNTNNPYAPMAIDPEAQWMQTVHHTLLLHVAAGALFCAGGAFFDLIDAPALTVLIKSASVTLTAPDQQIRTAGITCWRLLRDALPRATPGRPEMLQAVLDTCAELFLSTSSYRVPATDDDESDGRSAPCSPIQRVPSPPAGSAEAGEQPRGAVFRGPRLELAEPAESQDNEILIFDDSGSMHLRTHSGSVALLSEASAVSSASDIEDQRVVTRIAQQHKRAWAYVALDLAWRCLTAFVGMRTASEHPLNVSHVSFATQLEARVMELCETKENVEYPLLPVALELLNLCHVVEKEPQSSFFDLIELLLDRAIELCQRGAPSHELLRVLLTLVPRAKLQLPQLGRTLCRVFEATAEWVPGSVKDETFVLFDTLFELVLPLLERHQFEAGALALLDRFTVKSQAFFHCLRRFIDLVIQHELQLSWLFSLCLAAPDSVQDESARELVRHKVELLFGVVHRVALLQRSGLSPRAVESAMTVIKGSMALLSPSFIDLAIAFKSPEIRSQLVRTCRVLSQVCATSQAQAEDPKLGLALATLQGEAMRFLRSGLRLEGAEQGEVVFEWLQWWLTLYVSQLVRGTPDAQLLDGVLSCFQAAALQSPWVCVRRQVAFNLFHAARQAPNEHKPRFVEVCTAIAVESHDPDVLVGVLRTLMLLVRSGFAPDERLRALRLSTSLPVCRMATNLCLATDSDDEDDDDEDVLPDWPVSQFSHPEPGRLLGPTATVLSLSEPLEPELRVTWPVEPLLSAYNGIDAAPADPDLVNFQPDDEQFADFIAQLASNVPLAEAHLREGEETPWAPLLPDARAYRRFVSRFCTTVVHIDPFVGDALHAVPAMLVVAVDARQKSLLVPESDDERVPTPAAPRRMRLMSVESDVSPEIKPLDGKTQAELDAELGIINIDDEEESEIERVSEEAERRQQEAFAFKAPSTGKKPRPKTPWKRVKPQAPPARERLMDNGDDFEPEEEDEVRVDGALFDDDEEEEDDDVDEAAEEEEEMPDATSTPLTPSKSDSVWRGKLASLLRQPVANAAMRKSRSLPAGRKWAHRE